ncbi:trypsin, alkaline A [Bombyx mori]|uniref:Peptidase S1 domain-containing protein n=1 Tax=Bombyx mori TaxID=7091 RepID=A0A8R1WFM6_BOMMO|nr:trypsin, alkaline A [Bombyx mori]
MAYVALVLLLVAAVSCSSNDIIGTPVEVTTFPSIVQVEIRVGDYWIQKCAGGIITNYHIVSVATCFSGANYSPERRRVRAGASRRGEAGSIVYVMQEYNHYYFGSLDADGDISVVRLTGPLTFSTGIAQAPIVGQGIELPSGLKVVNVGWGTTVQGSQDVDDALYKLDLFTQNNDRCVVKYLYATNPRVVTENMICAGLYGKGRDFDVSDLGSPLYYDNVLVGLLSFGVPNADDEYPVVATAVSFFSNWITRTAV